jgi:hypothetical protein
VGPLIAAGCEGIGFTITAKVCTALLPHALSAVTVIFPLLVPTVAGMLFEEELPVHPLGKVHV